MLQLAYIVRGCGLVVYSFCFAFFLSEYYFVGASSFADFQMFSYCKRLHCSGAQVVRELEHLSCEESLRVEIVQLVDNALERPNCSLSVLKGGL